MDVIDRLRTLLRPCAWVRDSATALRLVPELAVDLPSPVDLVSAEGASERGVPVRCMDTLVGPVATVVIQLGEAALESKPREELHRATPERILADPLVPVVAELIAQASGPGLNCQAVPALAVAWLSSRLLAGQPGELKGRSPELYGRMTKLYARLAELPAQRRGTALADITWGLRGRLAAAVSVAQAAGWTVEAGGIYRRVMADPLVLAFPRGTLEDSIPFGVLSVLLGLPLEESLAGSIERAAGAVLPALVDRRVRGKATPTDDALASAFAADMAAAPTVRGVLFDIWSGPLLIASLPDLADARLLQKAGVSKDVSQALMRREVVRALAASWRDLVTSLLGWDVMSALISRLVPLRFERGRWSTPSARLAPHARWDLLLPRSALPAQRAAVVAVNLGPLRARVARVAQDRQQPILAGAADSAWGRLVADTAGGLFTTTSDRGIAAFSSPLAAMAFAQRARKVLSGPTNIPLGYLGDAIDVPQAVVCSVGMAVGEIRGGTDGASVFLDGPAIAEAIGLTGSGEPDVPAEQDPSGIRGAWAADDGLRSRGIVASGTAVAALVLEIRERNLPVHVRAKGGAAGGLAEDFEFYPFTAWWEADDGKVTTALALSGPTGPHEVLVMDKEGLSNLHTADQGYAASKKAVRPGASAAAASPLSGLGGGGFGGFGGSSQQGYAGAPQAGYAGAPQAGYAGAPQAGYSAATQQGFGASSGSQGFGAPQQQGYGGAGSSDPFSGPDPFSSSDAWSSGTTNPRPTTMPAWTAPTTNAPPVQRTPAPPPSAPAPPAPPAPARAPSGSSPAASWAAPAAAWASPQQTAPQTAPPISRPALANTANPPAATTSSPSAPPAGVRPSQGAAAPTPAAAPAVASPAASPSKATANPPSSSSARAPSPPPAPPAPRPSAADDFGFFPSVPSAGRDTELENEDLGDPFADFETQPGPQAPALATPKLNPPRQVPPVIPDPAMSVSGARPRAPWVAAPPPVAAETSVVPASSAPARAEEPGLEYFEAPTADAGALFSDAYDGPAVSIEEEDGWGGDSSLRTLDIQGGRQEAFPASHEPEDHPSGGAVTAELGWRDDFITGFVQPSNAEAAPLGDDDPFSFAAADRSAQQGRTENILELDAADGGGFAFDGGEAHARGGAIDIADRLTEDAGGQLLEAGGSGFAFVSDDEAAQLEGAEEAEEPVSLSSSVTPPPKGSPENPITWGDLVSLPGAFPAAASPPEPLIGGADTSFGGELFGEDPFPDGETGAGLLAGVDISLGMDGGDDDALAEFPLAPTAELDGLPDWETGGFTIEEPEDPPSVPSGLLRGPTSDPPQRSAPPPAPSPTSTSSSSSNRARATSARAASAPVPPDEPAPAGAPDFQYLFMGYVSYPERGELVFGRPYGRLLVDAHAYPASAGNENAYASFLKDKIREGFVPRTDMTRPYPNDQPGQKLELRLLNRAYRAMV